MALEILGRPLMTSEKLKQKDKKTKRQKHKDRKTERQKDKKTERQKDRKTERGGGHGGAHNFFIAT